MWAPSDVQVEGQIEIEGEVDENTKKFKKVSYELLDIGVYYTNQGVSTVKSQALYQQIDA